MSLLDIFKRHADPKVVRARLVKVRKRPIAGTYDAAQTTDDSERHWAAADALSSDRANSYAVRKVVRERARYEVANNSYALGIILTLANHTIGTGPRLQLQLGDGSPVDPTEVETRWREWTRAIRLAAKLRTMRGARAIDGESFAVPHFNPRLPTDVKLDLRLIECDRVMDNGVIDPLNIDGVLLDADGNVIHYHVLRTHPGGWGSSAEYDTLDADRMIHWFRADRPEQHRGISEIMPALPLFGQLRRYTLAVLHAAETAADFAAILYTDMPPAGEAKAMDEFDAIEIERNMMTTVPAGWKMGQMEAVQPTTVYPDFKREILNEIARCLNMPYNIAACNSSSYNYSSGRLDHQTYFTSVKIDRAHCETVVLDPLLYAWLGEARFVYHWNLPDFPAHRWFWDGIPTVDPYKDALAKQINQESGFTTAAEEFGEEGKDWEIEFEQQAREKKVRQTLGLNDPTAKPGGAAAPGGAPSAPADKQDEDEMMEDFRRMTREASARAIR